MATTPAFEKESGSSPAVWQSAVAHLRPKIKDQLDELKASPPNQTYRDGGIMFPPNEESRSKLIGEVPTSGDFSNKLHQLYRLNIRYHRLVLIKHAIQFRLMKASPEDGHRRAIQPSDMKALGIDLCQHCKLRISIPSSDARTKRGAWVGLTLLMSCSASSKRVPDLS